MEHIRGMKNRSQNRPWWVRLAASLMAFGILALCVGNTAFPTAFAAAQPATRTKTLDLNNYGETIGGASWSEPVDGVSTYVATGSTDEGWTFTYDTVNEVYTLTLDNVNITVDNNRAIAFPSAKEDIKITIVLKGKNTVSGGGTAEYDAGLSGIYSPVNTMDPHLSYVTITGDGSLKVSSNPTPPITHNYGKAIDIEQGSLTIEDTTVDATGVILAFDDITVNNSKVTVSSFNLNSALHAYEKVSIVDSTVEATIANQLTGVTDKNSRAVDGNEVSIDNSKVTGTGGAYGICGTQKVTIKNNSDIIASGHTNMGILGKTVVIEDSKLDVTGKFNAITANIGAIEINRSTISAAATDREALYAARPNNTDTGIILGDRMALQNGKVASTESPDGYGYTYSSVIAENETYFVRDPSNGLKTVSIYITADYTVVDEALKKIPSDLSLYTDASVKAVTDAKNAVVRNKSEAEQQTVNGYAAAIENAVKALVYKDADYTAVDAALKKIPADLSLYTDATVKAVTDAKNAVVRGKKVDEQEIVNGYATAIENAVKALVYKDGDYTAVDAALKKIPADLSGYTDASVKAVTDAKNAVVRGKNASEQKTINGYAIAIENAIKALKVKPPKSVDDFMEAVKDLPDEIKTKEDAAKVDEVKNLYDKLTEEEKALLDDEILDTYQAALDRSNTYHANQKTDSKSPATGESDAPVTAAALGFTVSAVMLALAIKRRNRTT